MTKTFSLALVGGCALLLSGCASGGLLHGGSPDEFAVQREAPLIVPPDFNLAPPAPGAPQPAQGTASQEALEALFGGPARRSGVETSALDQAGTAEPGIRSEVGDPETHAVAKGTVTRDILAAPEGAGGAAQAVIPATGS